MKKLFKLLLLTVIVFIGACSNDLQFILPQGPQGPKGDKGDPGKTAYELWVEYVTKEGSNYTGGTEIYDFFVYITGAKGDKGDKGDTGLTGPIGPSGPQGIPGIQGVPGLDGLSAYDLWVIEVANGLPNPQDETEWWPMNETSISDFWRYLRGKDGKDGKDGNDGKPGLPGTPGFNTEIIIGKPNVIAQYQNQENSEYVSWTDGAVTYIVYDDTGNPAPLAIVKGLPGMDPDEEFIADNNGVFKIPKDKLPIDVPFVNRFGVTTSVTYVNSESEDVTEASANNTYVPCKMQIRARITSAPTINSNWVRVPVVIERKSSAETLWERIPAYLGNLTQTIIAFETDDNLNPNSYTSASRRWYSGSLNISSMTSIDVMRPTLRCDYLQESYQISTLALWDNLDHYFTLVLNSYYGEQPSTAAIVKMAPIQMIPLVTNLKMGGYVSSLDAVGQTAGDFDVSSVRYDLFFNTTFSTTVKLYGVNHFNYYEPTVMSTDDANASQVFGITFTRTGGDASSSVSNIVRSTIASPGFTITDYAVYINSRVQVTSANGMFRSSGEFGVLRGNPTTGLYIEGYNNTVYQVTDIPITNM